MGALVRSKGIKAARTWLGTMESKVNRAFEDSITSEKAKAQIESDAMQIMNTVGYGAYNPTRYDRTFDLLASVVVENTGQGIGIGLNPDIAPSEQNRDVNYGKYMLQHWAAKSWLARTVPETLPRPFDYAWAAYFIEELPVKLSEAVKRRVR